MPEEIKSTIDVPETEVLSFLYESKEGSSEKKVKVSQTAKAAFNRKPAYFMPAGTLIKTKLN